MGFALAAFTASVLAFAQVTVGGSPKPGSVNQNGGRQTAPPPGGKLSPGRPDNPGIFSQPGAVFLENKGQWDNRVKFLARQDGLDYWVTEDGLTLDFHRFVAGNGLNGGFEKGRGDANNDATPGRKGREGHVIRYKFLGQRPGAQAEGVEANGVPVNFYVGGPENHVTGARFFREAYVKNLYPGVAMRNYMVNDTFRYDLVVAAGVDPSVIAFQVLGSLGLKLDGSDLVIRLEDGEIRNSKLYAFQPVGNSLRSVPARFKLNGNVVSFEVSGYDPRLPIIIDPLVYGTYLGSNAIPFVSSGFEMINGASADSKGNLYMTGNTNSITFPVTDGPYGFSLQGTDAFLIRLEADAYSMDYAAFIGGSGTDTGRGIGLSEQTGALWIGGFTSSNNFPGATNAFTGPGADYFLTKFTVGTDNSVTPNFSMYFSGAGNQTITNPPLIPTQNDPADAYADLAVGTDGSVVLGGNANAGILAGNGFTPYLAGGGGGAGDGFIAWFNADGSVRARVRVGGTGGDRMGRFDLDGDNNLVVNGTVAFSGNQDTATAANPVFPTTAGVFANGRLLRNNDAYVVKLNSAGVCQFAALLGGNDFDSGIASCFDPLGNIYVMGQTGSFDFPRTPGVYDQVFSGEAYVTKISPNGSSIIYSTGMRHSGRVIPRHIDADERGVVVIAGDVSFVHPGNPNPTNTQPGSIEVTTDALDGAYNGGDNNVSAFNGPPDPMNPAGYPSSMEGFIQFLNSAGSNVLYADYIGENSDDGVTDVFIDGVGATWVVGNTTPVPGFAGEAPVSSGIGNYLTGNAFKPTGPSATDGFAIKIRVQLPILNSVTFNPTAIAGGLGASSVATISLRDPAPVGGVNLTAELSNASASTFVSGGASTTTNLFIPEGATTTQVTVFSNSVNQQTTTDLRVTLDNDFIVARLTINPWLDEFTVTPGTIVGGNQLTARVRLFQAANQDIRVNLITDRPDLINLPNPPEIVVPNGATTATIFLSTNGVTTTQNGSVTASLLGVSKAAPVTLTRAELSSLTFTPDRVNGGETSTMTINLNGKAGSARTIDLTEIAGTTGMLVDGVGMPTTVTIPAQANKATFTVTAPVPPSSSFTTVQAAEGVRTVSGTLFIDSIDIDSIDIQPSTDVASGTILTGQVRLTRPAGPSGFTVNLSHTNPAAGTLSQTTVNVAPGEQLSEEFTFEAAIVASDEVTDIQASRPGFTTRSVTVTVRAISLALTVSPDVVTGGLANATGTVTLSTPAGPTGITINLSSSAPAAASVPASLFIPAGATSGQFTVTTSKVSANVLATISAVGSTSVTASDTLLVRAPSLVSLDIDPSVVVGGESAFGTVTLETAAPAGGVEVTLTANPGGIVSMPATVTVPGGQTSVSFQIDTVGILVDTDVMITASTENSVASAFLTVLSPTIIDLSFSPGRVTGGNSVVGTIVIDQPAPAGGLTINIDSEDPTYAQSTVATVTIPAGQTSATFTVTTVKVSREIAAGFSVYTASSGLGRYLFIKP